MFEHLCHMFYKINPLYQDFLRLVDSKVATKRGRPYIFIPIRFNEKLYIAPLSSSEKYQFKEENFSFKKIGSSSNYLGVVHINNMLPIKDNINLYVTKIDISSNSQLSYEYLNLLKKQSRIISREYFQKDLKEKAINLYELVSKKDNLTRKNYFYKGISNDFNKLERSLNYFSEIRKDLELKDTCQSLQTKDKTVDYLKKIGSWNKDKSNAFEINPAYRGLAIEELKKADTSKDKHTEIKIAMSDDFRKKLNNHLDKRIDQKIKAFLETSKNTEIER